MPGPPAFIGPRVLVHGTLTGYTERGCRCAACVDRASEYRAQWRAGLTARGLCRDGCGTPVARYKRCAACRRTRAAASTKTRATALAKAAAELAAGDPSSPGYRAGPFTHGTYSGYRHGRCRCTFCRQAKRENNAAARS